VEWRAGLTREPAVAGSFYPSRPDRLRSEVTELLAPATQDRTAVALVAPHAGYVYSGRTAGLVLGAIAVPAHVVVIAPNHTGRLMAPEGGSMLRSTAYRTPLGTLAIDTTLADAILAAAGDLIADDPSAHVREHAVEVILPFLQLLRKDVSIVPIVLAWSDWERTSRLADALARAIGTRDDVLVIASSDMNHYESATIGEPKDRAALEPLLALDGKRLLETTRRLGVSMCGRIPAACAAEYARLRGKSRAVLVDYRHSGLVNGDNEHVVGYAGVLLGTD
jgi:AmmeMemoRadiSam system protein B